jgi:hypothetical protein
MQAASRIRTASVGGKARARNLSPKRRREIAQLARLIRTQKKNGQTPDTERREILVNRLRASDPDLGAFVKVLYCLPAKYQGRLSLTLSVDEVRTLGRVMRER